MENNQDSLTPNEEVSETSLSGTWREIPDSRGGYFSFIPRSLEAAKYYIQNMMDSTEAPILRGIRTQTCHGCHRPLGDGAHQGSATGKNRCVLPHYFLCKGGIADSVSWKAWPEDYIFDPNLISAVGFESTLYQTDFMSSNIARSTPAGSPSSLHLPSSQQLEGNAQRNNSGPPSIAGPHNSDNVSISNLPPLNRDSTEQSARDNPSLPNSHQQSLRAISKYSTQSQPPVCGLPVSQQIIVTQQPKVASLNQPVTLPSHVGVSSQQQIFHNNVQSSAQQHVSQNYMQQLSYSGLPRHIQSQIDEFRASNQVLSGPAAPPSGYIQISQLRANGNLRQDVETGLDSLVRHIPSLSNATPHRGVSFNLVSDNAIPPTSENVYEWVIDSTGGRHLVCRDPPQNSSHQTTHSSHVGAHLPPAAGTRREYRCSPRSGRVWTVEVPLEQGGSANQSKQYRVEYRCCPSTGRVWQETVPVTPTPSPPRPRCTWEWRVDPINGNRFQVPVQITPDQSNVFKGISNSLGHALPSYSAGGNNFNPYTDSSTFQANPHSNIQNSSHTFLQSGADNRGNITGITRLPRPAEPLLNTKDLSDTCFVLPNLEIFIDKVLPPPSRAFVPNVAFPQEYFVSLHKSVSASGLYFPQNTPNYLGARIPLPHVQLKVRAWRNHLIGYEHAEVVQFIEFGFPIGLQKEPSLSLKSAKSNHGSAYKFYTDIDEFLFKGLEKMEM